MLQFTNLYAAPSRHLWVAIMFYTPNCDDGDWTKQGWWDILPGETKVAYGGDVSSVNPYWCFYAVAENGAYWAGQYKRLGTYRAFDECEWTRFRREEELEIGFRLFDVGDNDDYTLILRN